VGASFAAARNLRTEVYAHASLLHHRLYRQLAKLDARKARDRNIGDWGRPEATVPEYAGQLDGGLLERYIARRGPMKAWTRMACSTDGAVGRGMMGAYHKVMGLVNRPKFVIFGMKGKPTDYKTFRYGFASALMDDAYFDFSDGTGGSLYKTDVVWFDEYDLAGEKKHPLARSRGGYAPDQPWQKGVYRRRFQNGMALVNPRGNGDQIVTVGPGFKRFKGRQDPAYNNGGPAEMVLLKDRDGILWVYAATRHPDNGVMLHISCFF
jgi:hypothetical protein